MMTTRKPCCTVLLAALAALGAAHLRDDPVYGKCSVPAHETFLVQPPVGATCAANYDIPGIVYCWSDNCRGERYSGAIPGACNITADDICQPNFLVTKVTLHKSN